MSDDNKNEAKISEEEWMRQMFAGTIHNIGNVITVARLAVTELDDANHDKSRVLDIILNEMLPTMQSKLDSGELEDFLKTDSQGKEYLQSLAELLKHQNSILEEQRQTIESLNTKLYHVTEIIGLQQRLVGGIGLTEVVSMDNLINDAVKMMGESARRHKVNLELELDSSEEISVDSSLLTQVFINIIKNAIEALDRTDDESKLIIRSSVETIDGQLYSCCEFEDNGP